MKLSILFICLLLFGMKGMAQPPLNVDENFDNNNKGWQVGSNVVRELKIENGFYAIDFKSNKSIAIGDYFTNYQIDDEFDFIIESKIRYISGPKDHGYGIFLWDDKDYLLRTYVSPEGKYRVEHDGPNYTNIIDIPWRLDTNIVNKDGEFNIIRYHKVNKNLDIYINNTKVYSHPYSSFNVHQIGFNILDTLQVEVDYLKIYQYGEANVNLIKNPINGFVKENLGENINGKFSDRGPIISSDGNTLYYIKQGYPEIIDESQEIYFSTRKEDGNWTEAKNIGKPINNKAPNYVISCHVS